MRPDRLALEGACQPARGALGDGHREVVGPEHHEPLGERPGRGGGGRQVRAHVGLHEALEVLDQPLLGAAAIGHRPLRGGHLRTGHLCTGRRRGRTGQRDAALRLQEPRVAAKALAERGELLAARRVGRSDLRQQPAGRIGAQRLQPGLGQAETVRREGGSQSRVLRGKGHSGHLLPHVVSGVCHPRVARGCPRCQATLREAPCGAVRRRLAGCPAQRVAGVPAVEAGALPGGCTITSSASDDWRTW